MSKIKAYSFIFSLLAFLMSLCVFPYYTSGDQYYYIKFYEGISNYNLIGGYVFYRNSIGSGEPIYYLLIFFFSNYLEKTILISIFNALFSYHIALNLLKIKLHKFIVFSLIVNFYFLVLMFSAERLKVSLTFFIIGLSTKHLFKSYGLMLLSVLSHIQSLILLFIVKFDVVFKEIRQKLKNSFFLRSVVHVLMISIVFLFVRYLGEYVQHKYSSYSGKEGLSNVIKPITLYLLTLFYGQKYWKKISFSFIPLIMISFLVGEDRIVIFCYFIFFYFAAKYRRGINVGMFITLIYFLIKGIQFLNNIFAYNDGFHNLNN